MLVGATARDVLLSYAHGIALQRATHDVDLAFTVADWSEFETLRGRLIASDLFASRRNHPHRLRHRSNLPIDLIPFGGIERLDGTIVWPPGDAEVMGVLGYTEAYASAIEVRLPDRQRLNVVALPVLAILKLLAWNDRHLTAPRKDAADLLVILNYYLDAGQAVRLSEDAAHLLDDDAFDYRFAGAWLAGHDARKIIEPNSQGPQRLVRKITSILTRESDADGPLRLVGEAREYAAEDARKLLVAFLAGFLGQTEVGV